MDFVLAILRKYTNHVPPIYAVLIELAWHVVMGLNMKRKEKITIACGLSLGVFAGACSIVRTIELQSLSSMENYVYDTASMLIWSSSEVCLTIVCACIPILRPLYVRLKYGSRGDSSGKNSYPLNDYSKSKDSRRYVENPSSSNKIYMGPGGSILQTTIRMGSDTASEETILHGTNNHTWDSETGIKRTRDVVVTVETKDEAR
jgi:hypothetical protein